MSLNSYITLGHSSLRASPFCLGGMTFGEDWGFGEPLAKVPETVAGAWVVCLGVGASLVRTVAIAAGDAL